MADPRRRPATARSVLAGEASAEAARKTSQAPEEALEAGATEVTPAEERPSRSSRSPGTNAPPPSSTWTTR
ncbi:hypothetical protein ACFQVA_16685 [Actinomadura keratinilytica]